MLARRVAPVATQPGKWLPPVRATTQPSAGRVSHSSVTGPGLATMTTLGIAYVAMADIDDRMLSRELKKGSAELIILSIVEARARHGYEISKLIEAQSKGELKFHVASLYPLLYRLEERGWLKGRWVEKAGQRRKRFYSLTPEGQKVLVQQRETWKKFVAAIASITGVSHA
jgi:PadR family transcriptional regulator PadR